MNYANSILTVFVGGEDLTRKTDEEKAVKCDRPSDTKESSNTIDFEKITDTVSKVRDAVMTIRGSDISVKNWHFAVDKIDGEYDVDFTIKLAVAPRTMTSSETEMTVE